jgi:hypothetical protein
MLMMAAGVWIFIACLFSRAAVSNFEVLEASHDTN